MRPQKNRGRSVEEQLKNLQHEVLVAIASGVALSEVMAIVCRRAEQVAGKAICSILRVDVAGFLRPVAAPSLPDEYSEKLDGIAIGPMVGSCGSAAYYGEAVGVSSIATDPRWADYKGLALTYGLKACWSSPIKSHDGRVIGTFAFYFRRPRRPSKLEQKIVDRCAHLCALAIEHWEAAEHIRRLAFTDTLTGLGNRAQLAERFPRILERAAVAGAEVALFYVDLNGFRAINATRGHKVGDALLRIVADRIRETCVDADLVARLGADEFLIIQSGAKANGFEAPAAAISNALGKRYQLEGAQDLKVGVAIGVARFPHDGSDLDTLIGQADTALSSVKASGHAGVAFYSAKLDADKQARKAFEKDLTGAISAGQLSLVFQPQADACTSTVTGFEALVRWQHPVHGAIPPSKFIPAAEACGAIEELGAYVLRRALAEAAHWPKNLRVAVNVSPAQIVNADFAALVANVLAETGVSPARLEIEVTESLFIFDPETARKTLEKLKDMGVSVAIDDFGTGYSSLSTLRSLPFDRIKIDRSFLVDMIANRDAGAIVSTILELGRAIGRPVVAEGVETKGQLEYLRQQGCSEVQGYFIGKPLPIEQYAHLTKSPREQASARA